MAKPTTSRTRIIQSIVVVLILVGLYGIIPQLGAFRASLHEVTKASLGLSIVALGVALLSYFAAAASYYLLCYDRLRYGRTVLIAFAGMFINRLLPGGIGGIGVNYLYLRKAKLKQAQAASVIAINNVLGIIGHGLLLLILLTLFGTAVPKIHASHVDGSTALIGLLLLAVIVLIGWHYRQRVATALLSFWHQVSAYSHAPGRLLGALLSSMGITLTTVLSLWICVYALHAALSLTAVMIVFSLGIAIGTATPTPGGLGGFEAGLVAGFVAYGMTSSQALAIVLVYRLLSYWTALLIGGLTFLYVRPKHYF